MTVEATQARGKINGLNHSEELEQIHMGLILSSRSGHLCVDGKRVLKPLTNGLFPSDQFCDGDLSIPSTDRNILTVSQCFLDLYINRMGLLQEKRSKGKKWLHSTLEIEKEFSKEFQTDNPEHSKKGSVPVSLRQTRGWHVFSMHTLHRFFWKDFECMRSSRKL